MLAQDLEGPRLRVWPGQDIGCGIVAILTEFLTHALTGLRGIPIRAAHLERQSMQVVGGEIRSEVRAVTVDRAVLHEAVREK